MSSVRVFNSVERSIGESTLCFQNCEYPGGELGFRFIWKAPNGNLLAHRGQARIPSPEIMEELINMARIEGWYSTPEKEGSSEHTRSMGRTITHLSQLTKPLVNQGPAQSYVATIENLGKIIAGS